MKAAVAAMSPVDRRGSAFGVYNMTFGLIWFAGSALMGVLHDVSILALVAFSVGVQLAAIPLMVLVARAANECGFDQDLG